MTEPSRDALAWVARRTVAQHREPVKGVYVDPGSPRCPDCQPAPPDRCRQLRWAETWLAAEGNAKERQRVQ